MIAAGATLLLGVLVGYVAQRSRICFVGGVRDWLLIRDTELLKGALAFFLAAWVAFPIAAMLGGAVWEAAAPMDLSVGAAALGAASADLSAGTAALGTGPFRPWLPALAMTIAGLGFGFTSVLANGCPLRQHVLAGQGARDSWSYLGGFYAGAVVYHLLVQPLLAGLFTM